jgi:hypothetical protein
MKLNWIGGVLFAAALAIPASAQISVYIGHPPPRARYERRVPVPGPGYAWVGGYWSPQGGRYEWVPGLGIIHLIKERAGFVPIISTISKAGSYGKGTGTATSTGNGDK